MRKQNGITLVGTLVYIALLAIILPALVMFFLGTTANYSKLDTKSRIINSASVIFSRVHYEFNNATAFSITSSTLGVDESRLFFQNKNGNSFILESVSTTALFADTQQNINRLRLVNQSSSTQSWLTDPDLNIDKWNIHAVRDSVGTLTGLRVELKIEGPTVSEEGFNSNSFNVSTTINFNSSILEI
ncbi:MAG: hypothetical protein L3J07_04340 [Candidatus Magasanikbacteria bacterium]|nr:hypothetical protein [Candidatus Magasanikbacteria bacterium]